MPSLPSKRCGAPGCKTFVQPFTTYCSLHTKQTKWAKADDNRGGKDKFYDSSPWRKARLALIARQPICAICNAAASTMVDHINPRQQGGSNLDLDNLQGLCAACHNQKTGKERRARR